MSAQSSPRINKVKLTSNNSNIKTIAQTYPKLYLEAPVRQQELVNKVSGVTITKTTNELPSYLIKAGTASELRSKFTIPAIPIYPFFQTYGGAYSDYGFAITRTTDGNYIFGGHTYSFLPAGRPILLIKINDYGEMIWSKTYGGGGTEYIRAIAPDPNGGYILSGFSTSSSAGDRDLLLFHISENGSLNWARVIGSTGRDELRGAFRTQDGGIISAGFTYSFGSPTPQPIVVKLNADLGIDFAYVYNFEYPTVFWDLVPTPDGKYLAVGRDDLLGVSPYFTGIVAKIDSDGSLIWARRIYGNDEVIFYSCTPIGNGEYVLGGDTVGFGAQDADIFLVKINDSGELIKGIIAGGVLSEWILKVHCDANGNIIVVGCGDSFDYIDELGCREVFIGSFDRGLNLINFSVLGGILIRDQLEELRDVTTTFDGGYISVGHGNRYGHAGFNIYVIKVNQDLLIEGCPILRHVSLTPTEVEPSVEELYPTIIDVKNDLTIGTPNYTSYDVQPIVIDGCAQAAQGGVWSIYMEEWH